MSDGEALEVMGVTTLEGAASASPQVSVNWWSPDDNPAAYRITVRSRAAEIADQHFDTPADFSGASFNVHPTFAAGQSYQLTVCELVNGTPQNESATVPLLTEVPRLLAVRFDGEVLSVNWQGPNPDHASKGGTRRLI